MPQAAALFKKTRIESIDILRGAIMIIMAIDHTRDYFHLGHPDPTDLATTTPFFFFTRFITHFCAPTFVFLSGISAHLAGTRRTRGEMSAFLLKRGLWLLVVEFAIVSLATNLDIGYHLFVFQVIGTIGCSMIILAALIWFPLPVIGAIGAVIFFGHNIFDVVNPGPIADSVLWKWLISSKGFSTYVQLSANRGILLAYAVLPWTGVMLLGYVFGSMYKSSFDTVKRRKILLLSGLGLLAMFFVLRYFNIYGDPVPWAPQKTFALSVISFFDVSKYPCSLLYLGVTLGTSLVVLSSIENIKNRVTSILIVYGNVPLFYYLCHWYLLRVINLVTCPSQGFKMSAMFGVFDPPVTYGYSLGVVYLIWFIVIVTLYFLCRWYSRYKKTHTAWWLSYM